MSIPILNDTVLTGNLTVSNTSRLNSLTAVNSFTENLTSSNTRITNLTSNNTRITDLTANLFNTGNVFLVDPNASFPVTIARSTDPFLVFNMGGGATFSGFRFQINNLDRYTAALNSGGNQIYSRFTAGGVYAGDTLSLGANGNVVMNTSQFALINSTGNLGIGNAAPSDRLTVSGNISASGSLSGSRLIINTTTNSGAQDASHIVVKPTGVNIGSAINLRATGGSGEIYDGYIASGNGVISVGGGGAVSTMFRVVNGTSGPNTGNVQFSVNNLATVNVDVLNSQAAATVLRVTGSTGQTGNLTEWRNVTPSTLSFIDPAGSFNSVAAISSRSLIYASGGNSDNWNSAYTSLCAISAFRISNTITSATFPNGYALSNSDTGRTYHVDTRTSPVSVLLPNDLPNDFRVTLITLGTNNMHVSSSQVPMLCATGTRVNVAFASTLIYKYDNLFWGLGSLA